LISGAGIAGPVCAYWLHRAGYAVTIVERASKIRKEGQTIDVTTEGRVVFDAMGITETVMASGTKEKGLHFVDSNGTPWGSFPQAEGDKASFTREIEIVRGELARILYEATREDVKYVFDDSISGITQTEDGDGGGVEVTFAKNGRKEQYDILVIADGLSSRTRALAFHQDVRDPIRSLNQYVAGFSSLIDPNLDSEWAQWYSSPGRKVALQRPDGFGRIRSNLIYIDYTTKTREVCSTKTPVEMQKEYWAGLFKGAGWECERLVKGMMEANDFYVYEVAQVKMDRARVPNRISENESTKNDRTPHEIPRSRTISPIWSTGRVVLIGDAASCPSPISGQGTNVAIVQAYVLASMLRKHQTCSKAFEEYETLVRPWVDKLQKLPPGAPGVACPDTRAGVGLLLGMSWVGSLLVRFGVVGFLTSVFGRIFEGKSLEMPSPDLFDQK
jgi:2-polyprenyl-6-methoxyphenol hydroxylase-like FAD-dependent oxidoreductase